MKTLLSFILLLLSFTFTYGQSVQVTSDIALDKLDGTWVHSQDSLSVVEIKNMKWTFFYGGDTTFKDVFNVSIRDTIFGKEKSKSKLLVLNKKGYRMEYEILGLDDKVLSLMALPMGQLHLYRRKKTAH
jgi:hypothetical protein